MCLGSMGLENYIAQLLLIVNAQAPRRTHVPSICVDGSWLEIRVYCHMEPFQRRSYLPIMTLLGTPRARFPFT